MKKYFEVAGFMIVWGLMIFMGIRAGKNHGNCDECERGVEGHNKEQHVAHAMIKK